MTIYALDGIAPEFADRDRVFVAPGASLIGRIRIGLDTSFWFGAILRADNDLIEIGHETNVQDGAILHADPGMPTRIGAGCTIGHRAIVHGATIGAHCLIGMGATILNGAAIGAHCLIGANALVTEGKSFPEGSLIVGTPAVVRRALTQDEREAIVRSAAAYVANGRRFMAGLEPRGD